MLIVILLYDQLLFRPLVAWADKIPFRAGARRSGARFVGADHDAPFPSGAHRGAVAFHAGVL